MLAFDISDPSGMLEDILDSHVLFSTRTEPGPDRGDFGVKVDETVADGLQDGETLDEFPARVDNVDCVVGVGLCLGRVLEAAGEIDH